MDTELQKLRWRCRRGMLELDLLLIPFFDGAYQNLEAEQKAAFQQLLTYEDTELHSWLMGGAQPADASLQAMIALIRDFSVNRDEV